MVASGDDGGDVLGRDAVQVQVDLLRAFDGGPLRLRERLAARATPGGKAVARAAPG
jgi:hypothetical protein